MGLACLSLSSDLLMILFIPQQAPLIDGGD